MVHGAGADTVDAVSTPTYLLTVNAFRSHNSETPTDRASRSRVEDDRKDDEDPRADRSRPFLQAARVPVALLDN